MDAMRWHDTKRHGTHSAVGVLSVLYCWVATQPTHGTHSTVGAMSVLFVLSDWYKLHSLVKQALLVVELWYNMYYSIVCMLWYNADSGIA